MTRPYKFTLTLELAPGKREKTLTRAPEGFPPRGLKAGAFL